MTESLHPFPAARPTGAYTPSLAPVEHLAQDDSGHPAAPRTPPATPPPAPPSPDHMQVFHNALATCQSNLKRLLDAQEKFPPALDKFFEKRQCGIDEIDRILDRPGRYTGGRKKRTAWDIEWDGMLKGIGRVLMDQSFEPKQEPKQQAWERTVELKDEVKEEAEENVRRSARNRIPSLRLREWTVDTVEHEPTPVRRRATTTPRRISSLAAEERRARTAAATAARQRVAADRRAAGGGARRTGGRTRSSTNLATNQRPKTPLPRKRRKRESDEDEYEDGSEEMADDDESDEDYKESSMSTEWPPKGLRRPYPWQDGKAEQEEQEEEEREEEAEEREEDEQEDKFGPG